MNLSVIICTWQAPPSLDETLASVFGQEHADAFEVVLVNNGFSEARAKQLKENYPALRIINEPTPGLMYARRAGFRAAQGKFFVCLDDDNFLTDGFLQVLGDLVEKYSNLGCICPVVVPRWEQKPEEWLQEFGSMCLSYTNKSEPGPDRKEQLWLNPHFEGWRCPSGGGMIIHRSVAENYLEINDAKRLKLGRIRGALGGCEDVDICARVPLLGLNSLFSERLVLYHQIPGSRTRLKYLFKLIFRSAQDWAVMQRLWQKERHPLAKVEWHWHWRQFFHLSYAWVRVWLRTGKSTPRFVLEWAGSAGFLWGWFRDWLGSVVRND